MKPKSHRLARQLQNLANESEAVIAARTQLPATPETGVEWARMVAEKPLALTQAAIAASSVATQSLMLRPFNPLGALLGAANAWTDSVLGKVRANRRRLKQGKS